MLSSRFVLFFVLFALAFTSISAVRSPFSELKVATVNQNSAKAGSVVTFYQDSSCKFNVTEKDAFIPAMPKCTQFFGPLTLISTCSASTGAFDYSIWQDSETCSTTPFMSFTAEKSAPKQCVPVLVSYEGQKVSAYGIIECVSSSAVSTAAKPAISSRFHPSSLVSTIDGLLNTQ